MKYRKLEKIKHPTYQSATSSEAPLEKMALSILEELNTVEDFLKNEKDEANILKVGLETIYVGGFFFLNVEMRSKRERI